MGKINALKIHHMLVDPVQHQTDAEVANMVLELCKSASWMRIVVFLPLEGI